MIYSLRMEEIITVLRYMHEVLVLECHAVEHQSTSPRQASSHVIRGSPRKNHPAATCTVIFPNLCAPSSLQRIDCFTYSPRRLEATAEQPIS